MSSKSNAIVMTSLAADALALGAHWIYNVRQIDQEIGRVESLRAPLPTSFHKNRTRGDLTHYGDQTIVLLKSLLEANGFSLEAFATAWRRFMETDDGYRDQATKDSLNHFAQGASPDNSGSSSSDLGGAARIAPLVYGYRHDEDRLLNSVRQQTAMTHGNADVVESGVYFAKVVLSVRQGQDPLKAMEVVVQNDFDRPPFDRWVRDGLKSRTKDTREAIRQFGQACDVAAAFPGVVHIIAKYQHSPREGLIANVMAGGDSAARGLLAGMVFGAYAGMDAVRQEWVDDLQSRPVIERCLAAMASW
jgi:ADP-ribosylglycohydrolase